MRLNQKELEFWGPLNTVIILVFHYSLQNISLGIATTIHPLVVHIITAFLNALKSSGHYIATCMGGGVRVTKITGSSSDDWIYYHLGYKFS
jgi:hypothetical protein